MQTLLRKVSLGFVLVLLGGMIAVGGIAGPNAAQAWEHPLDFDHLKCYVAKDPQKVDNAVLLTAFQEQFGTENCELIGKRRLFCVPVNKVDLDSSIPVGGIGFRPVVIPTDRICYQVRCDGLPEDVLVQDQFGRRTLSNLRPRLLCTPAQKVVDFGCPGFVGTNENPPICGQDCREGGVDGICVSTTDALGYIECRCSTTGGGS